MNILVACEMSGRVRDCLIRRGHNAYSADLQPSWSPGPHLLGDVRHHLDMPWDMIIAFPPCTYLSRAGAPYWKERELEQAAAANFVKAIADAPAPRIAIENPIGRLNQLWRYPDQTIQPWWFGHPWTKATCLWLKGLPPLIPTRRVEPHQGSWVRLNSPGSKQRQIRRSLTCQGLAEAMANQWTPNLSTTTELSTVSA